MKSKPKLFIIDKHNILDSDLKDNIFNEFNKKFIIFYNNNSTMVSDDLSIVIEYEKNLSRLLNNSLDYNMIILFNEEKELVDKYVKFPIDYHKSILKSISSVFNCSIRLKQFNKIEELQEINTNISNEKNLLEIENKKFHRELTFASELQKNLLPKSYPFSDKIKFVSKYLPSAYIGGDFFDVVKISDDKIAIFIMDVSGHGIKSAMIASLVKTIFEKEILNFNNPKDFFTKLNSEFNQTIHSEDYLTCFLIVIDFSTMKATFSSAAHPSAFLVKCGGDIVDLKTNGFIIGIFDNTKYYKSEVEIKSGDRFVLYTDGMLEVEGNDGEQFGKEKLLASIDSYRDSNLEDLADALLTELIFYSKEPLFEDDITLLLFEIQ